MVHSFGYKSVAGIIDLVNFFIQLEFDVGVKVDEVFGFADEKYPLVEGVLVGGAAQ